MTNFTSFFEEGISVMCVEAVVLVSALVALLATAIALF